MVYLRFGDIDIPKREKKQKAKNKIDLGKGIQMFNDMNKNGEMGKTRNDIRLDSTILIDEEEARIVLLIIYYCVRNDGNPFFFFFFFFFF